MKKYRKRGLSLLLAGVLAALSMAGCGSDKGTTQGSTQDTDAPQATNTNTAMGRYLEEEIPLPEGMDSVSDLTLMEDGSYGIVGVNTSTMEYLEYRMTDGGEWTRVTLPEAITSGELAPNGENIKLSLAPNGELAAKISAYDEEASTLTNSFILFDTQGQAHVLDIKLPQDNDEMNDIWSIYFSKGNQLFVQDYRTVAYEVDKATGAILQTYDGDGGTVTLNADAGDQRIVMMKDKVLRYDQATGEPMTEDTVLEKRIMEDVAAKENEGLSDSYPILFASDEDGGLYFCNNQGIYYHAEGGTVCEQMVNGQLCSLSNPTTMLQKMLKPAEDTFLVGTMDDGVAYRLLKYTYSADTPAVPATELKVYALEESTFLRQAIFEFQKMNPDVYVNLEVGVTGEDAVTRDDALRTLNTDILAGNGPDVLLLDGMSLDSYIDKNMLLDISDIVQKISDTDGVFENVANAYEKDGKIYAVPAKFYVPMLVGDSDTVSSGSSLETLAARAEALHGADGDTDVYESVDEKILLNELFFADSARWMQEDGSVSKEALDNFLTQAKRIYDTNNHNTDDESRSTIVYGNYHVKDSLGNYILSEIMGYSQMCLGNLGTIQNYATITSAQTYTEGDNAQLGLFGGGGSTYSFVPADIAGISSATKQEDAARAFVEILLGSDTAVSGSYIFSTNKAAYEKGQTQTQGDAEGNIGGFSVSSADGTYMEFSIKWPSREQMDQLTAMLEQVNTPCINDGTILDIVLEQGEAFLKGEQSLEDASGNILQKVKLYLAE